MKKLLFLSLLLATTGCATLNQKLVDWPSNEGIQTASGQMIQIIGNPRIKCFNKSGQILADGLYVYVDDFFCRGNCTSLIVDEFGRDYIRIKNGEGNYCTLWDKR